MSDQPLGGGRWAEPGSPIHYTASDLSGRGRQQGRLVAQGGVPSTRSTQHTHRLSGCSQESRGLLDKGCKFVAPKLAAAIGDHASCKIANGRREVQAGAHSWTISPHTGAGQQRFEGADTVAGAEAIHTPEHSHLYAQQRQGKPGLDRPAQSTRVLTRKCLWPRRHRGRTANRAAAPHQAVGRASRRDGLEAHCGTSPRDCSSP